ncbi:carboxyl transferase domain-containing protein [Allorhizocola rhizosphaerae]|uniref:carboxyl transferase domain-containing protein n=1 Tax=Allorhizocola rhizosphaerae TaxID=1872709 RepID=UPI000E3BCEC2|nr:carboxyl transferase domain-containing protein [Allorhizocola rhizosphaerae]
MTTLETALDPRTPSFLANRSEAMAALSSLDAAHARAKEGGGEREVTRHHARGKLLPRERIELLVDRDTALLELAATAGHEQGEMAGAGVVTAIGVVEGTECMIIADDPTVGEDGLSERGRRKVLRAAELAGLYGLPLVSLVERPDPVVRGGFVAVFGAFEGSLPLADLTVVTRGHDEQVADAVADDERDALRLIRVGVRHLHHRPRGSLCRARPPCHELDDLLAVDRSDVREVLARVLDGSEFEELRAHRGPGLIAGFGAVHGCRVGILGNTAQALDAEAVHKGLELVRIARMPLVVLATRCAPSPELARALQDPGQVTVVLEPDPPDWALASRGFTFGWLSIDDSPYDGAIDPRDTRTVLGIALSAMGGR